MQYLHGTETQGASMGAKETILRDISCQCALFPVHLNSCGFPWVPSGRQVLAWSWSCVWAGCQGATSTCPLPWAGGKHLAHLFRGASESARAMVGCGERDLPSRRARDLHQGTEQQSPCKLELQESLPQHGCWPIYYSMRKVSHVLNYRSVIQPWGSAALVWQPYSPEGNYNPVICLSCLALFSSLLPYLKLR